MRLSLNRKIVHTNLGVRTVFSDFIPLRFFAYFTIKVSDSTYFTTEVFDLL